jgi:uncharacterized protein (TIGR02679 family)
MSSDIDRRNECVRYFREQTGFHRGFLEMRKKWKSYGKAAGKIKIKSATEEEKKALGSILGRRYWEEDIEFLFSDFEKALKETRFRDVPLTVLLEGYFGETLITNQEKRAREEQQKEAFWNRIIEWLEGRGAEALSTLEWVRAMAGQKQYGYTVVMGHWKNSAAGAETLVQNVCEACIMLGEVKEEGIPLAVLAAKITGNPHYFDRGQNGAALLLQAVCLAADKEVPADAAGLHQIYREAGIVTDEIASTVAFFGLHMRKKGQNCEILEAFCRARESGILSLANLAGAEAAWAEAGCAYVVENEMVFSYLVNCFKETEVTILCTSGQLSGAAQRLIRMLCENGTKIYYSGDMDPEGIGIAEGLWKKYPQNIHIWRMAHQDYYDALSEEGIEGWRMKKLQNISHPVLRETSYDIQKTGKASYQENLLEKLAQDILDMSRSGNLK